MDNLETDSKDKRCNHATKTSSKRFEDSIAPQVFEILETWWLFLFISLDQSKMMFYNLHIPCLACVP